MNGLVLVLLYFLTLASATGSSKNPSGKADASSSTSAFDDDSVWRSLSALNDDDDDDDVDDGKANRLSAVELASMTSFGVSDGGKGGGGRNVGTRSRTKTIVQLQNLFSWAQYFPQDTDSLRWKIGEKSPKSKSFEDYLVSISKIYLQVRTYWKFEFSLCLLHDEWVSF